MAIFQRNEEHQNKDIETVIGATVSVEGTFVGSGDIVVEGRVAGTLKTSKSLRIGQQAVLKADVEAANIFIAGEVRGQVKSAGKVELAPTAKVYGNVDTQTIAVAHGAILHGKVTMSGMETADVKDTKSRS